MASQSPQYISASRRNDLPRFFYNEFFDAWKMGEITYDSGYGRSYTVSLKPEDVLGYIFWSKDFRFFINHKSFNDLIDKNNAVFHFTINNSPALEPNIPPLKERLETVKQLCDIVGPQRVLWRYDPICKYRTPEGFTKITDKPFFELVPIMQKIGIKRCYFSFMTMYKKVLSRKIRFEEFDTTEKTRIAGEILQVATDSNIELFNCCNPKILSLVPGVKQGRCVDDELLRITDRFGRHENLKEKPTREGCGCCESRDIGSYEKPCEHGCLYCYANPAIGRLY